MKKDELRILQVGNVLVSPDIITEKFCCDLDACKGECCIEGDAGAPVTLDEIMEIEDALDVVWDDLSASAQAIIDKQGVAYTDIEGDLVTSIVNGKDCVFTCYQDLKDLAMDIRFRIVVSVPWSVLIAKVSRSSRSLSPVPCILSVPRISATRCMASTITNGVSARMPSRKERS